MVVLQIGRLGVLIPAPTSCHCWSFMQESDAAVIPSYNQKKKTQQNLTIDLRESSRLPVPYLFTSDVKVICCKLTCRFKSVTVTILIALRSQSSTLELTLTLAGSLASELPRNCLYFLLCCNFNPKCRRDLVARVLHALTEQTKYRLL